MQTSVILYMRCKRVSHIVERSHGMKFAHWSFGNDFSGQVHFKSSSFRKPYDFHRIMTNEKAYTNTHTVDIQPNR